MDAFPKQVRAKPRPQLEKVRVQFGIMSIVRLSRGGLRAFLGPM